jgi:hypothetical protein
MCGIWCKDVYARIASLVKLKQSGFGCSMDFGLEESINAYFDSASK